MIMTNLRVLFTVTFLAAVWFYSFTNVSQAQATTGSMLSEKTDQADLSSLKKNAESGDVKAEYLLGWSYMNGTQVPQDYTEAAKWYRKAAAQGSADAEFGLGFLYEQGKGVPQDYRQAVAHYTTAAKRGHATAQNNLASMYE